MQFSGKGEIFFRFILNMHNNSELIELISIYGFRTVLINYFILFFKIIIFLLIK